MELTCQGDRAESARPPEEIELSISFEHWGEPLTSIVRQHVRLDHDRDIGILLPNLARIRRGTDQALLLARAQHQLDI